jgi:hypothetical protein
MTNKDVFTPYEKFVFLEKISKYSVIFKSVYELGNAQYSNQIETACVCKDENNNLLYLINYDFFWSLNETEQLFVICHESLHLFFKHLNQIEKLKLNPKVANYAMDIVINETLVTHFGFNRHEMPIAKNACFIDTVFKQEQIEKYDLDLSKGYKYFYDVLMKELKEKNVELAKLLSNSVSLDDHQASLPSNTQPIQSDETFDNSEMDGDKQSQQASKNGDNNQQNDNISQNTSSNGGLGNNEDLDDSIGNNTGDPIDDDFLDQLIEDVENETEIKLDNIEEKIKDFQINRYGGDSGQYNLEDFLKKDKTEKTTIIQEKKWKKLVKWVNPSIFDELDIEEPSFAKESYPFMFTLNHNMIMPGIKETQEYSKLKIDLYFFFDVSGSCLRYQPAFIDIVKNIPLNLFNPHLFAFDTKVKDFEFDWKTKKVKKQIKAGGGTLFHIIEEKIQQDLKNNVIKKYPSFVCVLTDGMANQINNIPKNKEKNWLWLLINMDGEKIKHVPQNQVLFNKEQWYFIMNNRVIPFYDKQFDINNPKINSKIKKGCKIFPLNHL